MNLFETFGDMDLGLDIETPETMWDIWMAWQGQHGNNPTEFAHWVEVHFDMQIFDLFTEEEGLAFMEYLGTDSIDAESLFEGMTSGP